MEPGGRGAAWKSKPVSGRSRSRSSFCGTYPSRVPRAHRMTPLDGTAPMSARSRTVLPAPFGPMIASVVPRATLKLRSPRTSTTPNATERCSTANAPSDPSSFRGEEGARVRCTRSDRMAADGALQGRAAQQRRHAISDQVELQLGRTGDGRDLYAVGARQLHPVRRGVQLGESACPEQLAHQVERQSVDRGGASNYAVGSGPGRTDGAPNGGRRV